MWIYFIPSSKEPRSSCLELMGNKPSSTLRLAAVIFALLVIIRPSFNGGRRAPVLEHEDGNGSLESWLPLLLVLVVLGISLTQVMDKRFLRFDPYWIHRVGGSSCGIAVLLVMLALILRCKASLSS